MTKNNQFSPNKDLIKEVVYECRSNYEIDGMKINSIVEFVFDRTGINSKGSDEKDSYRKYCTALEKMLGASEPLQVSSSLKESNKDINISKMLSLLPTVVENITPNTGIAAKKSYWDILDNIASYILPKRNVYNESSIFENIEYTVIKVSKSGNNIEIIPSYMKIKRKLIEKKSGHHSYSDSESTAEYMHEKYVLTQFDIKAITDMNKKSLQSIESNTSEVRKQTLEENNYVEKTFDSINKSSLQKDQSNESDVGQKKLILTDDRKSSPESESSISGTTGHLIAE